MKGMHLSLEDRRFIQRGLEEGLSKAKIAKDLGKDPSTISKEIKSHRQFKRTCKRRDRIGVCNKCPDRNKCYLDKYDYFATKAHDEYLYTRSDSREGVNEKKDSQSEKEPANYDGHKYEDYLRFRAEHPNIPATEMDILYNNPEGPYIQTFIFENAPVMIGFLHKEKTSASMATTLDVLQERLGADFSKLFSLLITDRDTDFEKRSYYFTCFP